MAPARQLIANSGRAETLVCVLLVGTAVAFEYTGIDFRLIDLLWNADSGRWLLADKWWANALLHDAGRAFIQLIALSAAIAWVGSFLVPSLSRLRRGALYLCLSIALGAGTVNLGKALTNVDCPWSLRRYGGDRPYVHVFADRPDSLPRGHCFPGGHSSGAFALLSLYFLALGCRWRRPWLALLPGIVLGVTYAADQWGRGAHFPSHDLWSAAICWGIAAFLFRFAFRGRISTALKAGDDTLPGDRHRPPPASDATSSPDRVSTTPS